MYALVGIPSNIGCISSYVRHSKSTYSFVTVVFRQHRLRREGERILMTTRESEGEREREREILRF